MKKSKLLILAVTSLMGVTCLSGCTCSSVFSETPDLTKNIGLISYAARKYDNSMTMKKISKAIKADEITNEKQLFDALYYSFKNVMPELNEGRMRTGQFTTRMYLDEEINDLYTPFKFFFEKGLISKYTEYKENEEIDKKTVTTYLDRIHTYIGTSLNDDFGTAINHDLLYEFDSSHSSEIQYGSICRSDIINERVDSIVASAKKQGELKTKPLVDLYKLKNTTLNLENDYGLKTIIKENRDIKTIEQYVDWEEEIANHFGYSTLFSSTKSQLTSIPESDGSYKWGYSVQEGTFFNQMVRYYTYDPETQSGMNSHINQVYNLFSNDLSTLGYNLDSSKIVEDIMKLETAIDEIGANLPNDVSKIKADDIFCINDNDPFFAISSVSSYSLSYFVPDLYNEFTSDFWLSGTSYQNIAVFSQLLKDEGNLEGLKDLSLLCLFEEFASVIASEREGFLLNDDNLHTYSDHMVLSFYKESQEYRDTVNILRNLYDNKLKPSLKEMFNRSEWLSKEGNVIATEKLNNMQSSFLYEYEGHDYNNPYAFRITADQGLFALHSTYTLSVTHGILKVLKDSDGDMKTAFGFMNSPLTANAFYTPTNNAFYLCAGFVFSRKPVTEMNEEELLAELGIIIGHEMTHGFDVDGIHYDKNGTYFAKGILPTGDSEKFKELSNKMVAYFSGAEVGVDMTEIGSNVVGEATADQGALNACLTIASKNTKFNYEYFFKDLAANFYSGGTRETLEKYTENDRHPIGKVRINYLLKNCPKFIETFNIKKGDGMYLEPSEQFRIW